MPVGRARSTQVSTRSDCADASISAKAASGRGTGHVFGTCLSIRAGTKTVTVTVGQDEGGIGMRRFQPPGVGPLLSPDINSHTIQPWDSGSASTAGGVSV